MERHRDASEHARGDGCRLVDPREAQHAGGGVSSSGEAGGEEGLGWVEGRAGAGKEDARNVHPRGHGGQGTIRWRLQEARGRSEETSRVAGDAGEQTRPHGCMAGCGMLGDGQDAKPTMRWAACQKLVGNGRAD